MASCHLVADTDLPFLGDIYLGKLHYTVRKFISDLDLVKDSLVLCSKFLVRDAIVVDEFTYHRVGILVGSPLAGVDVGIVDALYLRCSDFLAFGNDFHSIEVADASTFLAFCDDSEFFDELGAECFGFLVEIVLCHVYLGFLVSLCLFPVALFCNFRIEGCAYDSTAE